MIGRRAALGGGIAALVAFHFQEAPVLTPEQELQTFRLQPGYRAELVAAEPLVQDPVAIDFDPDGRLWVVEMRAYMPNLEGRGEQVPVGRVVVLEDDDDDGRMDRKTIWLDSLILPRAIKVLSSGVLVAAPPYLWLTRDTTGDLRADTRTVIRNDFGNPESNPEHLANGLLWGLDNWIHNARYPVQLRVQNGTFTARGAPQIGQWGVGMDEFGRLYRNYNEDPLHADLVPAHYYARNPHITRTRGAYENLVGGNQPVWPAHPTPAVNRGYRPGVLRADSTLAKFTAAGSPVVYVGDRLPPELRNSIFVTESAGNLVHRFMPFDSAGHLRARNAYARSEFLASTHDRFRPVNLASAPDGTLYVVDMYRGIIQHRAFITGYLAEQIRARGMEQPIGYGRIWRVVHESTQRERKPQLARASTAQLVDYLAHPNGWWRMTSQRLIVERGDRSVVPALQRLATEHHDERVRLHALWALEGIGSAESVVRPALVDRSPHVRAAALRIGEQQLSTQEIAALARDSVRAVRWQASASLGEKSPDERFEPLRVALIGAGGDRVAVDASISGLAGQEFAMLQRLLGEAAPADALTRLAAAVLKAGDQEQISQIVDVIGRSGTPRATRVALLEGVIAVLPRQTASEDEPPPPADRVFGFRDRPTGLLSAAESRDRDISERAARILRTANWPGKPAPQRAPARPLTPAERQRFEAGRRQYAASCAACHQASGQGMANVANSLVGSSWATGAAGRVIRIVLHGKEGQMLMPPIGNTLTDDQVAAVLTYIRRSWGNQASPITPAQVAELRGALRGRNRPWTEAELERIR